MTKRTLQRSIALVVGSLTVASATILGVGAAAYADAPPVSLEQDFQAPLCPGATDADPAHNINSIVADATLVFGQRLVAYNEGRIVPLYDAFGATELIDPDGAVREGQHVAYPPICGTRYVAAVNGPVSEWMFCTDRYAQTCADTDGAGRLVDASGNPVNPMDNLDSNPKLTDTDAEKLIAYLVQFGHAYAGVGSQSWGGADFARSAGTTNERYALQTLVWCVSDPGGENADFNQTCAESLPLEEQQRLLSLIPDNPVLALTLSGPTTELKVGATARFSLQTNVYNQPIELSLSGSSAPTWTVCAGDASLDGSALTVRGTDPNLQSTVELCATAHVAGDATIAASATPPSLQHIGWSQSQNNPLTVDGCQVYATFHMARQVGVSGSAAATFIPVVITDRPVVPDTTNGAKSDQLANSGGTSMGPIFGLGALALLAGALLVGRRAIHTRSVRSLPTK